MRVRRSLSASSKGTEPSMALAVRATHKHTSRHIIQTSRQAEQIIYDKSVWVWT
jgi:hypothetical protein